MSLEYVKLMFAKDSTVYVNFVIIEHYTQHDMNNL